MDNIEPSIRFTNIIFTSNKTIIGDYSISNYEPYIKIQIFPTEDNKDIAMLKFWSSKLDTKSFNINEEFSDINVFRSIIYSINGDGDNTFERASSYMRTLSSEDLQIIVKEYTKYISDGILIDGFIAGIGAYIVFLLLIENNIFVNQIPFQFGIPYSVNTGNSINRNMFQHLSLALIALSKTCHGVLLQFIIFIQSFINIWEPGFVIGPTIDSMNQHRMCMEIISGFSQHITLSFSNIDSKQKSIDESIDQLEIKLQKTINDSIYKMEQKIKNLLNESRSSINDLVIKSINSIESIDDTIKFKINNNVNKLLNENIENKVSLEIEHSYERIGELLNSYIEKDGRKIIQKEINNTETKLKNNIIGLEHRIEILYKNFDTSSDTSFKNMSDIPYCRDSSHYRDFSHCRDSSYCGYINGNSIENNNKNKSIDNNNCNNNCDNNNCNNNCDNKCDNNNFENDYNNHQGSNWESKNLEYETSSYGFPINKELIYEHDSDYFSLKSETGISNISNNYELKKNNNSSELENNNNHTLKNNNNNHALKNNNHTLENNNNIKSIINNNHEFTNSNVTSSIGTLLEVKLSNDHKNISINENKKNPNTKNEHNRRRIGTHYN